MKATALLAILLGAALGLAAQQLLSEPGPTFRVADNQLPSPLALIAYADQRFTDPANTKQTNPRIRQWLANRIAEERPAAVIMNGDVPLPGDADDDYAVFTASTKAWRDLHLRVFPVVQGVTCLVSGGAGAPPYFVERTPGDLYQSITT